MSAEDEERVGGTEEKGGEEGGGSWMKSGIERWPVLGW